MSKTVLYSCYKEDAIADINNAYYGAAITTSFEENGRIFVTNGEYISEVNFCPFTGKQGIGIKLAKYDTDCFWDQINNWELG